MTRMERSCNYFWGITLDTDHKEQKWQGCAAETETSIVTNALVIRQAVLGPDANDEFNVVELECTGLDEQIVKIPICVMKSGNSNMCTLDVSVDDQVATLRLIRGSGPVHLSGTHQTETTIIGDDDDDDEFAEEEELVEEEEVMSPPKKKAKNDKPLSLNSGIKNKSDK